MNLGPVIRKFRLMEEKTVRKLASEIGISAPTLCRMEKGENVDGLTLIRVLEWLFSSGIRLRSEK